MASSKALPDRTRVTALSPLVKATTTPLASIFGSGFLVIVPILAGAVGPYSVVAMIGVCALAFAVGGVIRFNIAHAEPVLAERPRGATLSLERSSDLGLVLAYVISISLYLHILSSFVLSGFGADTGVNEDLLTTAGSQRERHGTRHAARGHNRTKLGANSMNQISEFVVDRRSNCQF